MTGDPSIQSQILGLLAFGALLAAGALLWNVIAIELQWRHRVGRWPFRRHAIHIHLAPGVSPLSPRQCEQLRRYLEATR